MALSQDQAAQLALALARLGQGAQASQINSQPNVPFSFGVSSPFFSFNATRRNEVDPLAGTVEDLKARTKARQEAQAQILKHQQDMELQQLEGLQALERLQRETQFEAAKFDIEHSFEQKKFRDEQALEREKFEAEKAAKLEERNFQREMQEDRQTEARDIAQREQDLNENRMSLIAEDLIEAYENDKDVKSGKKTLEQKILEDLQKPKDESNRAKVLLDGLNPNEAAYVRAQMQSIQNEIAAAEEAQIQANELYNNYMAVMNMKNPIVTGVPGGEALSAPDIPIVPRDAGGFFGPLQKDFISADIDQTLRVPTRSLGPESHLGNAVSAEFLRTRGFPLSPATDPIKVSLIEQLESILAERKAKSKRGL